MKGLKKLLSLCITMILVLTLFISASLGNNLVVKAAEKPVLGQDKNYPDFLMLSNGQNVLIINGSLVNVGDSGKGWSYPKKDLLKLSGGESINSILVTDDLEIPDLIFEGSRDFTIEVTGNNTIKGSMSLYKDIAIREPGGIIDENGIFLGTTSMFGGSFGINVMGSLTLTGTGTLVMDNDKDKPLSNFIHTCGDITINGPTIKADMKSIKDYYRVIGAHAYSLEDSLPTGTINFIKGSIEIKNVGSDFPPLWAYKGMTLAKGCTITAGASAAKAKTITYEKFWNLEEYGDLVGPSPKDYKYIKIQSEQKAVTAPGKVTISSVKSSVKGTMVVTLKGLKDVDGYQIVYSTSSKFTGTKTVTIKGTKSTIKSLTGGKRYYVKARAYRLDSSGKKIYGSYGAVKNITVKK